MTQPLLAKNSLHEELISRVAALEGKQLVIDGNRQSMHATIEALTECTDVDETVIHSIANQLSVLPQYVESTAEPTDEDIRLAKNTRIAKYCIIALTVLFTFSMLKWFNVNSTMKSAMHEVSSMQSRSADFHLRTGRYPHSFEQINLPLGPPVTASVKTIEMGPRGQLLIATKGFFGSQFLLTPSAGLDQWSTWKCSTNASLLFHLTSWSCSYQSSLKFINQ